MTTITTTTTTDTGTQFPLIACHSPSFFPSKHILLCVPTKLPCLEHSNTASSPTGVRSNTVSGGQYPFRTAMVISVKVSPEGF